MEWENISIPLLFRDLEIEWWRRCTFNIRINEHNLKLIKQTSDQGQLRNREIEQLCPSSMWGEGNLLNKLNQHFILY